MKRRHPSPEIETEHFTEYHEELDDNEGNVAFIINGYHLSKKPTNLK